MPSPDGTRIASVSFAPRPMKQRADLQFWGGATVWVVGSSGGESSPVTRTTDDTTYDLRWLDNSTLLFDRLSDLPFYSHSRIWVARLSEGREE